jgi:hypothetical protein
VLLTNGRRGEMDKSGPAFPYEGGLGDGLTKREWFAGLAMAGGMDGLTFGNAEIVAKRAVEHADALLAELAKGEGA